MSVSLSGRLLVCVPPKPVEGRSLTPRLLLVTEMPAAQALMQFAVNTFIAYEAISYSGVIDIDTLIITP